MTTIQISENNSGLMWLFSQVQLSLTYKTSHESSKVRNNYKLQEGPLI